MQAQAIKSKKEWCELWYSMAKGNMSDYDKIVRSDIVDFWTVYDLWEQKIKLENQKGNAK